MSCYGCLTIAIANPQVIESHLERNNNTAKVFRPTNKSVKPSSVQISDNPDFAKNSNINAHRELNAIANKSLVSAVLDGKLKTQKTAPISTLVPQSTLKIIKEFEGFSPTAYIDTDGTPVIGYGQSKIQGKSVQIGDRVSSSVAHDALESDVAIIQKEILSSVKVELNKNQLSALISLAFNAGVDSVKTSTLVAKLNQKDHVGAANEFLRWDKANIRGQLLKMEGLAKRRVKERQLFLAPVVSRSDVLAYEGKKQ
jgi:lysozyme